MNKIPPIIADIEEDKIPSSHCLNWKFQADQALGDLTEQHFAEAKKLPKIYNAITPTEMGGDFVFTCDENYYCKIGNEKLDPFKLPCLSPSRVPDPNIKHERIQEFNHQLEVAFDAWKVQMDVYLLLEQEVTQRECFEEKSNKNLTKNAQNY